MRGGHQPPVYNISIHALLAESDACAWAGLSSSGLFLSTLSLRRATGPITHSGHPLYISIHALLAESDRHNTQDATPICISIHALLAESDREKIYSTAPRCVFLSTLSLRRATTSHDTFTDTCPYFYPRSPCGERHRKTHP